MFRWIEKIESCKSDEVGGLSSYPSETESIDLPNEVRIDMLGH